MLYFVYSDDVTLHKIGNQCPYFNSDCTDGCCGLGYLWNLSFDSLHRSSQDIFDRIDELKPWGKLLGDNIPTEHLGQLKRLRRGKTPLVKNT